ncbi:2-amino-4-hydroxy-6-hydroxymethyldihydropteridine diphosphokinase [Rheinheimera sp. MMS21-TC3]|uniref:2-amino-4-hydroxy-6- hydroxymethyldihydropteridine diphosphokinase n=1 Tax=Rheinheimera sp. MMS21-TC3 TaxID=3072790 RepID=UPI0028C3BCBF|nr:2-amino-4-hydroxy-6-hydroxymethyldihydropteridine diphosphokinase [Rheinheimera sp. MMS21-TC3]WNO60107.1 2-amino-4-hydroxy-6-hydroxymethyldihydropteridine diphosphokinase [Rheinheimera sp. MMS21-TC3]
MALIYISVGSNMDRDRHIRQGVKALEQHLGALQLSSVYESEAVGFCGDSFYNLVVGANTGLSILECKSLFKQIEDKYGRDRTAERFSGRTLDLDLLTYDDLICQQPVQLPRAEITENAFVLWPLAEIAPQQIHPITKKSYAELWRNYAKQQKLWPVPFDWS